MKKILIFSLAYYPDHVGGAEVAIKEITDRINPEEIEFHLICNRYDSRLPKKEQIGNITVHRIGIVRWAPRIQDLRRFPLHLNKLLYQFLALWHAYRLHWEHHFDGIWAMMAHATGVPAGLFKTFFPEVTYLLTLQEGDPPQEIERTMRVFGPLFRRGFTKADVVQPISTFLAEWAHRMGARAPLEVIPNGVDVERFSSTLTSSERYARRQALGAQSDDVVLVTASRLVRKNGIDDVLRALAYLPQRVRFVIFGTGPEEAVLRKLAHELGIESRVSFRGAVGHEELPRSLAACDIFVRPSRSEGMGNAFLEAMAVGLPVVATNVGGIADFLIDVQKDSRRATGWVVEPDDPESIVRAVRMLMERPEDARSVTSRAQSMVREHYDWDVVVRAMRERVFVRIGQQEEPSGILAKS